MNEPDHNTDVYRIVRFIHRFIREKGREPTTDEIISNSGIDYEVEVEQEDLDRLNQHNANYLVYTGEGYGLRGKGAEFLRNAQLMEVNERLIEREKQSAAVETLFTIALLMVGIMQVGVTLGVPSPIKTIFSIATPLIAIGVIGVALIMGGDNLSEVWKKEKNRWANGEKEVLPF
jgi:hypothetical protein